MIYDVDYFIDKFSKIPEDKWYVGDFTNKDETKCCALGHCGDRLFSCTPPEAEKLIILFNDRLNVGVPYVNDGECPNYQQPTPKQRILAALNDIKAMQSPVKEPSLNTANSEPEVKQDDTWGLKPKTVIKYVVKEVEVEKELRELEVVGN